MSAQPQPRELLTAEEYLRRERLAEVKSEYVNGFVYAMAGARVNHNRISSRLNYLIQVPHEDRQNLPEGRAVDRCKCGSAGIERLVGIGDQLALRDGADGTRTESLSLSCR